MFEFAGVRIRAVEEGDLPLMVSMREDPRIWQNLGHIEMINLEKQHEWFKVLQSDPTRRYFILSAMKVDFLGIVRIDEIDNINRSARVGGDILPKYQRKGYGTRMFKLIKKYCFDYLNMNRLWLFVLETNKPAIGLYRKSGFSQEGRQREAIFRNGRYIDYIMMSILLSDYRKETDR